MRSFRACLFLTLVAVLALVIPLPPSAASSPPVGVSAPTPAMAIVADRGVVGRGDGLNFMVWLNVTGSGQITRALVNVTFNTAADLTQNSLAQGPAAWTQPGACSTIVASGWFLQWQCLGLGAGSYAWAIPANVPGNASVGHYQRVMASTLAQIGTAMIQSSANESVWIAGAVVRITDVVSAPAESARAGQIVQFWVNATNEENETTTRGGTGTAFNVTVSIQLDPGLQPGHGLASLNITYPSLPPQALLSVNLSAIVADNLTTGSVVGIHVWLRYYDFNGHGIGPVEASSPPIYVVQSTVLSTPNLLAGAAIGLVAILSTLVVLLYMGQRKIVIDEVFLMHKSGVLLRHVSQEPTLRKDDDLVASMFVALQEFIRDSFRKEASLDAVTFGGRRAAVVRGELTILAAVISRGDIEYVIPEMLAAVRAVEVTYWDSLVNWDGSMASLGEIDEVLQRLMRGQFRSPWRVQLT